ncbi:MAG: hypothetical protein E7554_05820 [Ruminococcaceae bacterium]|nr:hypothetical protein [Oscillospiraceae bacterium]
MNCLKCGKEIPSGVLCEDCQKTDAQSLAEAVEEAAADVASDAEAVVEEAVTEIAPVAETAVEEAVTEIAPVAETAVEEAIAEVAPVAETAVEEAIAEVAPVAETAVEEATAVVVPVAETAVEEAVTEVAPVAETVVEEAAAVVAPVAETAVEEAAAEVAPVAETAVEEAAAVVVPVAETAEEAAAEVAPVEETAVDAAATEAAPAPKKKKWPKVLAIVMSAVLVLGIGAGAVYWYFLSRQDNKSPVVDTMDRLCTSVEELDFYGILNCMFTDDLMDILGTYLEATDMSFDDIQEMLNELVAEYGGDDLSNIDVSYRIIGEPTEVEGEEFDAIAKKMKMMFINDVEKIIKADIELYMNAGEDSNTSAESVYIYCVEDKWYMLPGTMFEESVFELLG